MDDQIKNRKTNIVLLIWLIFAGLFGVLIGVPWSIAVLEDSATVWLLAGAEFLLFLVPASVVGVWLGNKLDLTSELSDLISSKHKSGKQMLRGMLPALIVGLTLGGIGYIAQNAIPNNALISGLKNPDTFEWFLRCLSAALTEEIFFRLGLLTLFAWLIMLLIKKPVIKESSLWIGNLFAALVFALAHLPQLSFHGWFLLIPFILFSTSAGMIMGWLFIRYGLVSAIFSHFVGDVVVYVVPRL